MRMFLDLPKAKPLDLDNLQKINDELDTLRTLKAKVRLSRILANE